MNKVRQILIILSLIQISCSHRIALYESDPNKSPYEFIKLDYKEKNYDYIYQRKSETFESHGTFIEYGNKIRLELSHHSETDPKSPIRKGYYQLKKVKPNNVTIIHIKAHDVDSNFDLSSVVVAKLMNGNRIRTNELNQLIIKDNHQKDSLTLIAGSFYFDQTIILEEIAEYTVNIGFQIKQTLEMYSDYVDGCRLEITHPIYEFEVCETNGKIKTKISSDQCKIIMNKIDENTTYNKLP